jgi:hypothetical protein
MGGRKALKLFLIPLQRRETAARFRAAASLAHDNLLTEENTTALRSSRIDLRLDAETEPHRVHSDRMDHSVGMHSLQIQMLEHILVDQVASI